MPPIEPRNLNRAFDLHCEKAGVPRIRFHDTRHTCASLLAALDVHPRVAMRILRHSQISVTMNVYTQIQSTETRKALDRLARALHHPGTQINSTPAPLLSAGHFSRQVDASGGDTP